MEDCYLLMSLAGISCKKQAELLKNFGSAEKVFEAFSKPHTLQKILSDENIKKIEEIYNSDKLENFKFGLIKTGVKFITIQSEKYPQNLKEIFDPPMILYYKGNIDLLKQDSIAIVGSRVCTRYGAEQTRLFSRALTKAGLVIISGLAEGIDAIAQKECVECGGKTIVVLAGRLNDIYPSVNKPLAEEILKKDGLIICENLPHLMPRYGFVQRNRIIAGLSLGVFVPEAGEKSGSLHTVEFANDNGRHIFALPGPVNSSKSVGTNRLIKCYQGCCVTEPNDIISNFPQFKKIQTQKTQAVQLDLNEQLLLSALQDEELHYEELIQKTQLDSKTLNSLLTRCEIRGLIIKLAGNYYARKS
ncbi:MAG: DNA-processing protein DprA [Clostridia bacterium]|nr:DNA-processing protein DprA [Clostridia bacterium]